MRAWKLALPLLALAPLSGGGARVTPPAPDPLANIPICGDELPVGATPQLYAGFGNGGFPIETNVPRAQAFFDNGMQLAHAFAHQAASAAFAEAVKLDPKCAMCLWGAAWSDGPTINFPVGPAQQKAALAKAVAAEALLTPQSPQRERDLIAAIKLRYVDGGGKGAGDLAFAKAMDALAVRYPQDDEIATIAADAWMIPDALNNTTNNLPRAVALLEDVLKRNPDYTPAIHFYIHATEMSGFPKRAEPYADKLARLAPASSHLIHMPSHTFYWVGRYQDAAIANLAAVDLASADAQRDGLTKPGQIWYLPYHGHNVQYGVGGALISGDGKAALALADPLIGAAMLLPTPDNLFIQSAIGTGYFAEGRFADPAKVLALPAPDAKLSYVRDYWLYARGEAMARRGDAAGVRAELAKIAPPSLPAKPDELARQAHQLVLIGQLVLEGRAAMIDKRYDDAARAYREAAKLDEAKLMRTLSDPPAWWYPPRRSYAAALLAAGKLRQALAETIAVLGRRPDDPVTLWLRAEAEDRLGMKDAATTHRAEARKGWHGDAAELTLALA